MTQPSDFIYSIRSMNKSYENMLKMVCEHHQLTLIEATIISFLWNNPGRDTAGDIVKFRGLSKGNVSQAVDNLIRRSLLKRTPDLNDRRKIHLSLLPSVQPVTAEIDQLRKIFEEIIFSGFSTEEIQHYADFHNRIIENIKIAMKRGLPYEQ